MNRRHLLGHAVRETAAARLKLRSGRAVTQPSLLRVRRHDPCAARERHDTTLHGGVEDWTGDITGRGTYSYDRKVNLSTGASVPAGGPCTRGGTRMT